MNPLLSKILKGHMIVRNKADTSNLRTVISFSLYGNVDKYIGGLIENCKNINKIYPDFWIYIYLGNDFDRSILEGKFDTFKNILFIETDKSDHEVMSYRFFAIDREEVGIALIRDADSRINARDQYCINEFLKSDKKFQIIRDNEQHGIKILGGMWGIKKGLLKTTIFDLFRRFKSRTINFIHGTDQDFLTAEIYPLVRDHSIIFDEYFNFAYEKPQKILNTSDDNEFVGAPVYIFYKAPII